ncbi:N-acetylneuraminate synthase [Candidatus Desantisbacteria bacterium]|nr:N-acetylneuraminate synthase [Candidatus Desantisbacteria bacterium]
MKTFIIAEAGVNHNGHIDIAKKLVDIAADAGADAIKFQTFKAEKIVTTTASCANYQIKNTKRAESQFDMLKKLELSIDGHKELLSYCLGKNITFMSTPFDENSADMLNDFGMNIFKIPSGEITNMPLIKHIAKKNKSIILSTGMSYLGEIEKAINWINEEWEKINIKPQLSLLHCVSNYPAKVEDTNLLAMKTMENAFGLTVGYSDHTMGIEVPIAAVAIGAKIIEKHFTIDRKMEGPDHKASLEPYELEAMIKAIRNIEKAMGNGIKRPVKNEENIKKVARRSLVAAKNIKAGAVVSLDDIQIKRPGEGISPEYIEVIINRKARADIKKDSLFKWDDFLE